MKEAVQALRAALPMMVAGLVMAGGTLALAGCHDDDDDPYTHYAEGDAPVAFAATSVDDGTAAAATSGATATGPSAVGGPSFGVYGYYTTGGVLFDPARTLPYLMQNQEVRWDGGQWTYSPLRYWPSTADNAAADQVDRFTLLAYAPWADVATVDVPRDDATGVVKVSGADAVGTPTVSYRSTGRGTTPDLMWAVAQEDYTGRAGFGTLQAGFPFVNVARPTFVASHIPLHFRHALGKLQVRVKLHAGTAAYDFEGTRLFVESLRLESADGTSPVVYTSGTLALLNSVANEPEWRETGGGLTTFELAAEDFDPLFRYTPMSAGDDALTGVLPTAQSLMKQGGSPLLVPATGGSFRAHIVYHVVQADGTDTTHDLTSPTLAGLTLQAGRTTVLNIQVGPGGVQGGVTFATTVTESDDWSEYIPVTAFSVAPGKQVELAPSNLQYDLETEEYQLGDTQLAAIGLVNMNRLNSGSGVIDLFGWGTGSKPAQTSQKYSDYSTFDDWGKHLPASFGTGWRTLSGSEWQYLLEKRYHASVLFGQGKVGGVRGLILLPDNFNANLHAFTPGASDWANTYSWQEWLDFEKATGAAFLPTAGYRMEAGVQGMDAQGYYWSSTGASGSYGYILQFYTGYVSTQNYYVRNRGLSVRLARDVE